MRGGPPPHDEEQEGGAGTASGDASRRLALPRGGWSRLADHSAQRHMPASRCVPLAPPPSPTHRPARTRAPPAHITAVAADEPDEPEPPQRVDCTNFTGARASAPPAFATPPPAPAPPRRVSFDLPPAPAPAPNRAPAPAPLPPPPVEPTVCLEQQDVAVIDDPDDAGAQPIQLVQRSNSGNKVVPVEPQGPPRHASNRAWL